MLLVSYSKLLENLSESILNLARQDAYLHSATGKGAFQNHWSCLARAWGPVSPNHAAVVHRPPRPTVG
jgi:hypothetical protein